MVYVIKWRGERKGRKSGKGDETRQSKETLGEEGERERRKWEMKENEGAKRKRVSYGEGDGRRQKTWIGRSED